MALNLNIHLHALVLDGVFARAADGRLRFHRAPAPTADDAGVDGDRFADTAPLLAGLAAAAVQGVLAVGGVPGWRPQRLGEAGTAAPGRISASAAALPHARWGTTCMRVCSISGAIGVTRQRPRRLAVLESRPRDRPETTPKEPP